MIKINSKPKTLIIDGEYLLKRSFHSKGSNLNYKGNYFGTLYVFIITLKSLINKHTPSKVVVFWDNNDGMYLKRIIYPFYKANRDDVVKDEEQENALDNQRIRIKNYLEELFVRQFEEPQIEADDLIAYYCQNSPNERKVIYTADVDLCQLINEDTNIHLGNKDKIITKQNYSQNFDGNLIENIKIEKTIMGCSSDNIAGIKGMGDGTFYKLFPEVRERPLTIDYIKTRAEELLTETKGKENQTIKNLLTGKTKFGIFENEFFVVNEKIVDLSNPILNENAKEGVMDMINGVINPEGRSYNNVIKMMTEDGIINKLPTYNEGFYAFFEPFMYIINKEKTKYNKENETIKSNSNT